MARSYWTVQAVQMNRIGMCIRTCEVHEESLEQICLHLKLHRSGYLLPTVLSCALVTIMVVAWLWWAWCEKRMRSFACQAISTLLLSLTPPLRNLVFSHNACYDYNSVSLFSAARRERSMPYCNLIPLHYSSMQLTDPGVAHLVDQSHHT